VAVILETPDLGRTRQTWVILAAAAAGWAALNVAILVLAQGFLPFDRPSQAALPFGLQVAMPSLALIEQFALMALVWALTRRRAPFDMAARAPARVETWRETIGVLAYAAAGEMGGWIVGPAFGYRPFSFHLAGSMGGCSNTPSPGETLVWASYNFLVFAVIPYVWFRRRYTNAQLNLVSTDRKNDWTVLLSVLVVESAVTLMAFPGVFKMTPGAFLTAAPIAFVVFLFGTVLPTMVLIYAILLPRYLKLTGSTTLSVILGGLTYASMHLVEGWSALGSLHDILLSGLFAILSYTGPGMFKTYVTLRTGNAWVHALGYHGVTPHVTVDTPLIAKVFKIG
jgi:hypothetical protein